MCHCQMRTKWLKKIVQDYFSNSDLVCWQRFHSENLRLSILFALILGKNIKPFIYFLKFMLKLENFFVWLKHFLPLAS